MAIRPKSLERVPIENVEVEYVGPRKPVKPGFNRVRMLDVNAPEIELATREHFKPGEKLSLSVHAKGIRDFLKVDAEVKSCEFINILKQPAYAVLLQFIKPTPEQTSKANWAREQLIPKQKGQVIRRDEEKAPAAPVPQAAAAEKAAPAEAPVAPAAKPAAVKRPVALLQLMQALDKFSVTEDLIVSVLEAAEAGMDVEALYPLASDDAESVESEGEEPVELTRLPEGGTARPMQVYRLSSNTKLYFADNGLPQGPGSELIYLSRLKSPETCFAVELGSDSMTQTGLPAFMRGAILIFSTNEKVDDGDFAFVRGRANDEFAQVFFDKEEVRIRPLNAQYRERVVRRAELKALCKLVGHYQDNI